MSERPGAWLVGVGAIGIGASVVAIGVWWSLLTAPEAAAGAGVVNISVVSHWAMHVLRVAAAWL